MERHMTENDYDFGGQVEWDRITGTAATAAAALLGHNTLPLFVGLTPGDATAYRLALIPPSRSVAVGDAPTIAGYDDVWIVSVITPEGSNMLWSGDQVVPDYVHEKLGCSPHTAKVVCAFLNELAVARTDRVPT